MSGDRKPHGVDTRFFETSNLALRVFNGHVEAMHRLEHAAVSLGTFADAASRHGHKAAFFREKRDHPIGLAAVHEAHHERRRLDDDAHTHAELKLRQRVHRLEQAFQHRRQGVQPNRSLVAGHLVRCLSV